MSRPATAAASFLLLAWASRAHAEPPRVHVSGGAAHAIGGAQSDEFGSGGAGDATVELPVATRLGVQGGAGALVLAQGAPPRDGTMAATRTGAAFLGTVGVRLRGYGGQRVAGPWVDSNVGFAHTGDVTRPAFAAHLGWEVRMSRSSRVDVGPFVGYTQIFQPDAELRGSDARILTAGLSISLGAKEPPVPVSPTIEPAPGPPEPLFIVEEERHAEELAEVLDICPDGAPPADDGCGDGVRLYEDRILLEDILHFEFDRSIIRPTSVPLVQKVARFINAHPDIVDVSIEGHADEIGTEEYNRSLSADRARSMRALLVKLGVDARQLHVVAHGKSRPRVISWKREAENRRVEMVVTRTRSESAARGSAASQGKSSR